MKYKSEIDFEQSNMVGDVANTICDDSLSQHEKFMLIVSAVNKYNDFLKDVYELEGWDVPEEEE